MRGASKSDAAKAVGKSAAWASGQVTPTLSSRGDLHHEAKRALTDFAFFCRAYLGLVLLPWHVELADTLERLTATAEKEYAVVNVAPGAGKTTAALAYAMWRIVRDRSVRILFISNSLSIAEEMVRLVRAALEWEHPPEADPDDLAAGIACEAWRVLADDFGTFRPLERSMPWKATGFDVQRYDGAVNRNKEPTCTAAGAASSVLSRRFDVVLCDDLDDLDSTGTPAAIDKQRSRWDKVLEPRLQPRGVLALIMQRLNLADLSHYNLQKAWDDTDGQKRQKYHHVVFPAHFDELCTGNHGKTEARPWPHGCLLDPARLPWEGAGGLRQVAENTPQVFDVVYQQRDGDPDGALIRDVWLTGGIDHHEGGKLVPGCWDTERRAGDLPEGIHKGSAVRVASVDPSPSRYWAVNDVVAVRDGIRIVVDSFDGRMSADELLDWDHEQHEFKGIMHRWQMRSIEQGFPIRMWIVEDNSANKFLLPYNHVKRWCQQYQVTIRPHTTTGKNKLDPNLGPAILKDPHRTGLYRYPRGDIASVRKADVIRQQLTTFPSPASRSDQVMSLWFIEHHLPTLFPRRTELPNLPRPSWLRGKPHRAA